MRLRGAQCLLHEVTFGASGIVGQFAETGIPKAFVKAARLELEGIEPRAVTATRQCLTLRTLHQICAYTAAAERVGDEQQLHEQPVVGSTSPQAANHLTFRIVEGDDERLDIASSSLRLVIGDERSQNPVATGLVWNVSCPNRKRHDTHKNTVSLAEAELPLNNPVAPFDKLRAGRFVIIVAVLEGTHGKR